MISPRLSIIVLSASFWLPTGMALPAVAAETAVPPVVQAARAFLATLDPAQQKAVQFDFRDTAQRARWSNLPVDMAKRGGLRMGDLTSVQRTAALDLLKTTLSPAGFEKVMGIVYSDEFLRRQGDSRVRFGEDEFFLSFLGVPSPTTPWILQFGGHHLALNITHTADQGVLTPSLIAVQPARFEWNGKILRPMGRETDLAFELMRALSDSQRKSATLGAEMRDLVLGPGHDGETLEPEGVRVATFTPAQRQLLLQLIVEWSGIIHADAAIRKLKEIESHLDETWFAWSGPMEAGKAYFRIQGPTVVIEYAPQRLGGDVTQHIHSMYRDPTNDYGQRLLQP